MYISDNELVFREDFFVFGRFGISGVFFYIYIFDNIIF